MNKMMQNNIQEFLDFLNRINKDIIQRNGDQETREMRNHLMELINYLTQCTTSNKFNLERFQAICVLCREKLLTLIAGGYVWDSEMERGEILKKFDSYTLHIALPNLESEQRLALERVEAMAAKFEENRDSFTRRADLVNAYKKGVFIDLNTIPAWLRNYCGLKFKNLDQMATHGFWDGYFHKLLRADLDLSSYPSEDPDWKKLAECVHEAAELIRSIAAKAGYTIDSPKLFEPIDRTRDDVEYQMPEGFTGRYSQPPYVPEFRNHVHALADAGKRNFGVSVAAFGVSKGEQRIRPTRFVGMNPGEWSV